MSLQYNCRNMYQSLSGCRWNYNRTRRRFRTHNVKSGTESKNLLSETINDASVDLHDTHSLSRSPNRTILLALQMSKAATWPRCRKCVSWMYELMWYAFRGEEKTRREIRRCVHFERLVCGHAPIRQKQLLGNIFFNLYYTMFIHTTKYVCVYVSAYAATCSTFIFMTDDYDNDVDDAVHADNGNSHEHTSYCAKHKVRHKRF